MLGKLIKIRLRKARIYGFDKLSHHHTDHCPTILSTDTEH